MTPAVRFEAVSLGYGPAPVLSGVDLTVGPGEVMALLGPSGSGKTTLLHAVAGFVLPRAGRIRLGDRTVSAAGRGDPPERRRIGMVFQNYALWPHLPVADIVAYPLRRRGVPAAAARRQARDLLDRVGVAALADRRPAELSGGEQQRVGLARALAADPAVFLFDEPTAHLDAHLRTVVLTHMAQRRAESGAAALYATHDAAEALAIADRVAVLHSGRLAQVATPAEVYAHPADHTVAALTGPLSTLRAPIRATGPGAVTLQIGAVPAAVACDDSGRPGVALVRSDWARLGGELPGVVTAVRYGGSHTDYDVRSAAGTVLIRELGAPRRAAGERTTWSLRRVWFVPGPADQPPPASAADRAAGREDAIGSR